MRRTDTTAAMQSHTLRRVRLALAAALVLLSVPAFAGTCEELTGDLGWPSTSCAQPTENYSFAWTTDDTSIWLAVDLTTDSSDAWAGLGPSEGGGMKGSDLWVVARTSAGGLAVHDLWSTKFGMPIPDPQQDVVLVAPLTEGQVADPNTPNEIASRLTEKPGRLRALLRRDLHACDARDLSITVGLPQPFVWAHGTGWPAYHGPESRGTLEINFVPPEGEQPIKTVPEGPLPEGTFALDLLMPNVTVPTVQTSYLCSYFELPSDRKYQIIAEEPVTKTDLLHHIILFSCNPGTGPFTPGQSFDCITPPAECSTFVIAWAPGVKYTEFPAGTGFPFGAGTPEEGLSTWFTMQVHYNNPQGETVPPDTSGLRITYTSNLRPNDLGVLTLSQMNLVIPGQRSRYVTAPSLCPGECTTRFAEPVTLVYSLLHMHETGSSITTRHIRGDEELAPIGRRRYWDFNFQGMSRVPQETSMLEPGDSLITQCTYNTIGRDNVTLFGEGTQDEMCFNFVVGYPRSAIVKAAYCFNNPGFGPGSPDLSNLAYCPSQLDVTAGAETDIPPEQLLQTLVERGIVVNATWPSSYSRYADPLCTGETVTPFGAP